MELDDDDDEEDEQSELNDFPYGLVVKLLINRPFLLQVVINAFQETWAKRGELVFKGLARIIFLLLFKTEEARNWVLEKEHWRLDGHLLALTMHTPNMVVSEAKFSSSLMWIQLHGLTDRMFSEKKLNVPAAEVGEVKAMEISDHTRTYMRFAKLRVLVFLDRPLIGSWLLGSKSKLASTVMGGCSI